ncbi:MAG: thioesterase family protein [Mycobacterium sp.]|uniref:thioesterase family protein n=1 Tax=Mycobacterium sp. TaxID=1785 RepID=UPI001EB3C634|nr:thioesterase family protein [Mycobacterium sp.]MBW0018058.1 thioesterase family protein [Mycobacterium sp.]
MADAYYEFVDADDNAETFRATDLVISTWAREIQNAAPVSALLVRALERCASRDDARLGRVVIDLLGPIPAQGDLRVRARVERPGIKIELVVAELLAADHRGAQRVAARATGWRLQCSDSTSVAFAAEPMLASLSASTARDPSNWERNYLHSIDWRWINDAVRDVPGEAWIRPIVDLVAGEEMTPLQGLFAVADAANGMGSNLDVRRWSYMNTDLTVHLHRLPHGPWIGIRSHCDFGSDGVGTSIGTLFDQVGPLGSLQQCQLLRALVPAGADA